MLTVTELSRGDELVFNESVTTPDGLVYKRGTQARVVEINDDAVLFEACEKSLGLPDIWVYDALSDNVNEPSLLCINSKAKGLTGRVCSPYVFDTISSPLGGWGSDPGAPELLSKAKSNDT